MKILDVCGTAGKVVKDIADFQIVQIQISFVEFSIGFLKQVNPYLVGCARGKFRFS